MKEYYDITPTINSKLGVFPGDKVFNLQTSMDFSKGDHLKLSAIEGTVHLGAHVDATNHYSPKGVGIEKRDPLLYLGDCQVIEVANHRERRIYPEHIGEVSAKRVLFKTNSFPDPHNWNDDFHALSPELIVHLKNKNVCLVGIDTPSVDPIDSKALESHNEIFKQEMAILEGIDLSEVGPGKYTLMAIPLKIEEADASPVRALLFNKGFNYDQN